MPYDPRQYASSDLYIQNVGADGNVENALDQRRIRNYDLYDEIYRNSTQTMKITIRGDDELPIYIPSARKIVEATNRFLGLGFNYYLEPQGQEAVRAELDLWLKNWFKRETVRSKVNSNKRWGLIRGDAVFMLYADSTKGPGERISIAEVHPKQVFRIEDPNNSRMLLGYHIIEQVQDFREPNDATKTITARRTFKKEIIPDTNSSSGYRFSGRITGELTFWTNGKWDDRPQTNKETEQVPGGPTVPVYYFPEEIKQLPVYIWNTAPVAQNSSWGTSVLSGIESLIFGMNQSLTDEDFTLVMQGLGMYTSNAGPPVDPVTNQPGNWQLGPGQVIEVGESQQFGRVTGVSSVSPYQDHMSFMDEKGLSESSGTPEVAIGRVDVQTAESGISLKLQLMPLIAANAEREENICNVLDQFFYDLVHMWLPAFEPETFNSEGVADISCVTLFDDPMPRNRDTEIQETLLLYTSDLILLTMAVAKLRELGWEYPTSSVDGKMLDDAAIAELLKAQAQEKAVNTDPFALTGGYGSGGAQDNGMGTGDNTPGS